MNIASLKMRIHRFRPNKVLKSCHALKESILKYMLYMSLKFSYNVKRHPPTWSDFMSILVIIIVIAIIHVRSLLKLHERRLIDITSKDGLPLSGNILKKQVVECEIK